MKHDNDKILWRKWSRLVNRIIATGWMPYIREVGVKYDRFGCPLVRRGVSAKPLNKRERRWADAVMEGRVTPVDPHKNRRASFYRKYEWIR